MVVGDIGGIGKRKTENWPDDCKGDRCSMIYTQLIYSMSSSKLGMPAAEWPGRRPVVPHITFISLPQPAIPSRS